MDKDESYKIASEVLDLARQRSMDYLGLMSYSSNITRTKGNCGLGKVYNEIRRIKDNSL